MLLLNDQKNLYKMYARCSPREVLHSQLFLENLDTLEEHAFACIYVMNLSFCPVCCLVRPSVIVNILDLLIPCISCWLCLRTVSTSYTILIYILDSRVSRTQESAEYPRDISVECIMLTVDKTQVIFAQGVHLWHDTPNHILQKI